MVKFTSNQRKIERMSRMLVEDKRTEKFCSFFVSEFHLEMILMPYINKKIEEKEKIVILTEKNLEKTVKELISKVNLKEENKQKILNLGWRSEEHTSELQSR